MAGVAQINPLTSKISWLILPLRCPESLILDQVNNLFL